MILINSYLIVNNTSDPTVRLLLRFNTDYSDSSVVNATITNSGCTINSSTFKFGAGSLYTGAAGTAFLQTPASTNYSLGTSDFTIEFWIYFPSFINSTSVLGNTTGGAFGIGGWHFYTLNNRIYFRYNLTGANIILFGAFASSLNWIHVAVVRNGTSISTFGNGVLFDTKYNLLLTDSFGTGSTDTVYVPNAFTSFPRAEFYLDDLRITKAARYKEGYSLPTSPF